MVLIAGACGDPVTPIPTTDPLSARGGIPGPNRPYFVLERTQCGDGWCDYTIAGLKKPDVLTVTIVGDVSLGYSCDWAGDGPDPLAIDWDNPPDWTDEQWDEYWAEVIKLVLPPRSIWTDTNTVGPMTGIKGEVSGSISVNYTRHMPCPENYAPWWWDVNLYGAELSAVVGRDTLRFNTAGWTHTHVRNPASDPPDVRSIGLRPPRR